MLFVRENKLWSIVEIVFIASNDIISKKGLLSVSSRSRLNYTGTHWLLYTTGANGFSFLPRLEIRNADFRHFGTPKSRNSALRQSETPTFGTSGLSAARNADSRYFGIPESRNADLGQQETYMQQKSTTVLLLLFYYDVEYGI